MTRLLKPPQLVATKECFIQEDKCYSLDSSTVDMSGQHHVYHVSFQLPVVCLYVCIFPLHCPPLVYLMQCGQYINNSLGHFLFNTFSM